MGASLDAIWQLVQDLNDKVERLPGLIELNANQINIVSLDELSETLGLIKAGEFRTGNLRAPGDSFSGVRMGYPGFYYPGTSTASSDLYMIAGVDADTLAVGINATDGSLYFGGGAGVIDDTGITINIGGNSDATPPIKWIDSDLITYRAGITAFNIIGDTDSLSFEILAGVLAESTAAGIHAQMLLEARSHQPDTSASTGDFYIRQGMIIRAGPSALDTSTGGSIFDWDYSLVRVSDTTDVTVASILRIGFDQDTAGLFEAIWNDTEFPSFAMGWSGDSDLGILQYISTMGVIFGGTDTNTGLDIGYLNEKALTFASTATAGIEDPDNEMGKLWLDTGFEMRLTDTAGEDWYLTRSTSTGGAANIIFNRLWTEDVTDLASCDDWLVAFGSDTSVLAQTGEIVMRSGFAYEVGYGLDFLSTAAVDIRAGVMLADTAGALVARFVNSNESANRSRTEVHASVIIDSGLFTPGSDYLISIVSYSSLTPGDRRFYSAGNEIERYLSVTETPRTYTITT